MLNDTFEDVTVTTATRSEDEIRASLGEPAKAAVSAPTAEEVEQEAESPKPDAELSDAGRKLREGRKAERKARLQDEVSTYEESIRALGGVVPAPEKREYKSVQDELDHLTRRRYELSKTNVELLKKSKKPAPPTGEVARPGAAAPAAPTEKPTFEFKFPTWEEYQGQHPEAEYTEYVDARNDARDEAKDSHRQAVAKWEHEQRTATATSEAAKRAEAEAPLIAQHQTAVESFKAEHADYDEVTSQVNVEHLKAHVLTDVRTGQAVTTKFHILRDELLRDPNTAPSIQYYLGQHPEMLDLVVQAKNRPELFAAFGAIRYAAKAAFTTATPAPRPSGEKPAAGAPAPAAAAVAPPAVAAQPPKPKPGAPAPLEAVSGASHARSAAQIAEDSEDADPYIDARMAEARRGRGR